METGPKSFRSKGSGSRNKAFDSHTRTRPARLRIACTYALGSSVVVSTCGRIQKGLALGAGNPIHSPHTHQWLVEQADTGLAVLLNWIHETPISLSQGTSQSTARTLNGMQSAWHSSVMLLRSQVDVSQRTDTYVTNRPLQQAIRAAKAGGTWRFTGSYKYGSKSPRMGVITTVTLLITPLITTQTLNS